MLLTADTTVSTRCCLIGEHSALVSIDIGLTTADVIVLLTTSSTSVLLLDVNEASSRSALMLEGEALLAFLRGDSLALTAKI